MRLTATRALLVSIVVSVCVVDRVSGSTGCTRHDYIRVMAHTDEDARGFDVLLEGASGTTLPVHDTPTRHQDTDHLISNSTAQE
jgi:hypothetical protein